MSDDWADEASPSQRNELDREWDLRREQHYNVSRLCDMVFSILDEHVISYTNLQSGYREGLDQGKEQTLQQGFDSGTASSTKTSLQSCIPTDQLCSCFR